MSSVLTARRGTLAAAAAALAFVLPGTAGAAEVVKLDLSSTGNETTGSADTTSHAAASSVLETGKAYVITVSGTGSIWSPGQFTSRGTCGVGEAQPMEPTPGRANSVAGWDAATVFASPRETRLDPLGSDCDSLLLPISTIPAPGSAVPYAGFEMALGTVFNRPTPVGGRRSVPRADHTYTYEVVGKGAPARFRFPDKPAADNSGILTITIRAADECAATSCTAAAGVASDQTPPATTVSAATQSVSTPGERVCAKVSVLKLKVVEPRGVDFTEASFYINAKKRKTVYRKARKSSSQLVYPKGKKKGQPRTIVLSNLPTGSFKLRIVAVTTRGQRITVKRTIAACSSSTKATNVRFK